MLCKAGSMRRKTERVKIICQICGKEFEDIPSNYDRKFCSWGCKVTAQIKSFEYVCVVCGKPFKIFERYNNGNGAKFCSQKCRSSQKIKKICKQCNKLFMVKPSQSSQNFCSRKCQVENGNVKRKRVCKYCGNVFMVDFPNDKHVFCSMVCTGKGRIKNEIHKISICTTCGKEFAHTVYDVGRYCSKKCYLSNNGVSGVELMLKDSLINLGFEHQLKYKIGHMDYGNEEKKIAVFVDGRFWHGKNDGEWEHTKMAPSIKRAKVRDVEQTAYLESCGWTVLRYWDDYVRANTDECLSDILKVVHDR